MEQASQEAIIAARKNFFAKKKRPPPPKFGDSQDKVMSFGGEPA